MGLRAKFLDTAYNRKFCRSFCCIFSGMQVTSLPNHVRFALLKTWAGVLVFCVHMIHSGILRSSSSFACRKSRLNGTNETWIFMFSTKVGAGHDYSRFTCLIKYVTVISCLIPWRGHWSNSHTYGNSITFMYDKTWGAIYISFGNLEILSLWRMKIVAYYFASLVAQNWMIRPSNFYHFFLTENFLNNKNVVVLPTAYFFHWLCSILFAVLWIRKLIGKHLTQNKSLHSCHLDRTMMSQWQEADFNSLRFNHCLVLSVFLSFLSDSRLVIRCLSPLLLWCGMRGKAQKTGPMTQWSCWVWIPDRAWSGWKFSWIPDWVCGQLQILSWMIADE